MTANIEIALATAERLMADQESHRAVGEDSGRFVGVRGLDAWTLAEFVLQTQEIVRKYLALDPLRVSTAQDVTKLVASCDHLSASVLEGIVLSPIEGSSKAEAAEALYDYVSDHLWISKNDLVLSTVPKGEDK